MPQKRYRPEDIIAKLREADVLLGQGRTVPQMLKCARRPVLGVRGPDTSGVITGRSSSREPCARGALRPRGESALHRAGKPLGARTCRVVQRQASGRAAQRGGVPHDRRGKSAHGLVARRVQPRQTTQLFGREATGAAGDPATRSLAQAICTTTGNGTVIGSGPMIGLRSLSHHGRVGPIPEHLET